MLAGVRFSMANPGTQATQPARQKSSMMERLRRLRTLSTPPAPTVSGQGKSPATAPRRTAVHTEKDKRASASKTQPRHLENVLDLEKLDSKLQEYADLRARDEEEEEEDDDEEEEEEEDDEEEAHSPEPRSARNPETGDAQGTAVDPRKSPDPEASHTARLAPGAEGQAKPRSDTIEIIVHPPEPDEPSGGAGPSDFELFLQQAEKDERLRQETGQPRLPKAQPPQLNRFYSSDWPGSAPAAAAAAAARLTEIQESDEASDAASDAGQGSAGSAGSGASPLARPSGLQGSSRATNSGSHDFAGTPEAAKTATGTTTFVPPKPGRHVSFCEPVRPRDRSDSCSSAYHVRGYESPQAPRSSGQRRSIRAMMASYIRQI